MRTQFERREEVVLTNDVPPDTAEIDLARECLYRFFAAALSDPRGPGWESIASPTDRELAGIAADLIREQSAADPIPLAFAERPAEDLDLSVVRDELRRPRDELAVDFDRAFGLVSLRECPPYGTEYSPNSEPFFRAQQLADVTGFYAAFGLIGGRAKPERADHIALELEFMAHLLLKQRLADDGTPAGNERAETCADAARRFFRDHLALWVPSFATALQRRSDGFYAAVARALAAFVPAERGRLDIKAPQSRARPAPSTRPEQESEGCAGCAARD